ncbi:MAG: gliding motility protein GldN [Flavobacteriaceae bacterium]|nr:gliding motility protein GldN [Flavobacteriaceae bacterium]
MSRVFVLLLFFVSMGWSYAQSNLLNAKYPEEIGMKSDEQLAYDNDQPLPYGYINDRDVLWGKMTWEIVDLDERVNFPLYYPVDTNNIGPDRRSLFHVLMRAVKDGSLVVYDDSYFNNIRTLNDLQATLKRIDTADAGFDQLNAQGGVGPIDDQYVDVFEIDAYDVQEYRIKGYWYFDTRHSEMKYRLLGIAPVTPDVNFLDAEEPALVELFWVWFPDVRELLHEAKAFNNKNSAKPISFDHLLNSRRFSATIYQIDNVQGDRQINEYIADNAMLQLLESERLKNTIRDFELGLWNY